MNATQDIKTLTLANTEYSYSIPPQTKAFSFKIRSGGYDLKYYFVSAASPTTYSTLAAGSTQTLKGVFEPTIIYFQCAQAGEVVEIEYLK